MDEVMLTREGISIRGEKRILLCASLFYFRIPRDEWEDRIRKLKASGYNCADVYFPWNYHETAPGQWDFGGDRDAEEFLRLLESNGLFVIARPGPYICSEWDGGGIPAWVLTDRTLRIRQNDPDYLGHVRRWYEKILPVIAAHQADKGGSVILMQLENELDFYDCDDSRGYMDALRGMAREMGITRSGNAPFSRAPSRYSLRYRGNSVSGSVYRSGFSRFASLWPICTSSQSPGPMSLRMDASRPSSTKVLELRAAMERLTTRTFSRKESPMYWPHPACGAFSGP